MSEHLQNGDEYAFDEASNRVPIGSDRNGEELLDRACAELALTDRETAMSHQEFWDEHLPLRDSEGAGAAQQLHNVLMKMARVCAFIADQKTIWGDCIIMLFGEGRIIDCKNQRDLVERHKLAPAGKSNVSKWLKKIQRRTDLNPIDGMREDVTGMRGARVRQLTARETKKGKTTTGREATAPPSRETPGRAGKSAKDARNRNH